MTRYITWRLLQSVPLVFGITVIVFLLVNAIPGSPIRNDSASRGGAVDVERTRELLGLDDPLFTRYFTWIGNVLTGDLGNSYVTHRPVLEEITTRLPSTLSLAAASLLLALVLSVVLGVIAAVRANSIVDHSVGVVSVIGISMPSFWLGLILIMIFSVELNVLPVGGDGPVTGEGGPFASLPYLILPTIAAALSQVAAWTRFVRGQMLEALSCDYVRTARAKGLPEWVVVGKHALRNSMLPMVTLVGLSLPNFFSGAPLVEVIFARAGIGRLAYDSAVARDYPVVMGTVLFASVMVVIGNLLADVVSSVVDPRVRVS